MNLGYVINLGHDGPVWLSFQALPPISKASTEEQGRPGQDKSLEKLRRDYYPTVYFLSRGH